MATRSLTEIFVLMRNNTIRNKNIYSDQSNSFEDSAERMHLIALNDVEAGLGNSNIKKVPPSWIDQLEEAQFGMIKLKTKIDDLKKLHDRSLHMPTFDESSDNDALIDSCTSDITVIFNSIHRLVQLIKSHSLEGTVKERRLTQNVIRSLATSLQDLSIQFRTTQNSYLRKIQSREERNKIFFENPTLTEEYNLLENSDEDIDNCFVNSNKFNQQLLMLEEENTKLAQQREQEVNTIVKSIIDLNGIFKELSQMVADQGTVLDRIDYNIEISQTQVYEGFKQLQKADAYQRKNRKMCAIIVLATTTILLIFILVLIKS